MENEQADAERDDSTRLARPNYQARTGTEEIDFPCSADHEQDWQPYLVDRYSAICYNHTYLTTTGCVLFRFSSFFFVSLEVSLLVINFYVTAVFSLCRKYRSYFPVMTW